MCKLTDEQMRLHTQRVEQLKEQAKHLEDKEQWLFMRRASIGASDVSTVMGANPYKSPYQLWLEKTGRIEPFKGNSATHWGQRLENIIFDEFSTITKSNLQKCDTLVNADFPYLTASPDGIICDDLGKPLELFEAKTASRNTATKDLDDDGFTVYQWGKGDVIDLLGKTVTPCSDVPIPYLYQVTTGMLVTGLKSCRLASLISTSDFRVYTIPFNEELAQLILNACYTFYTNCILLDQAPPKSLNDFSKSSDNGTDLQVTIEQKQIVEQYKEAKANLAQATEKEKQAKEQLLNLLEDNASLSYEGKTLCTYKAQRGRSSINWLRLEIEDNALYQKLKEQYTEQGASYRVLRIKK